MVRLEKSCAFRKRTLTCPKSQFQASRPPTRWTRSSARLAHATKLYASPRSGTLDVGRATGLPTRSPCVAENESTSNTSYWVEPNFVSSSHESQCATHARVCAIFLVITQMLRRGSTRVNCHVPAEAIKGFAK